MLGVGDERGKTNHVFGRATRYKGSTPDDFQQKTFEAKGFEKGKKRLWEHGFNETVQASHIFWSPLLLQGHGSASPKYQRSLRQQHAMARACRTQRVVVCLTPYTLCHIAAQPAISQHEDGSHLKGEREGSSRFKREAHSHLIPFFFRTTRSAWHWAIASAHLLHHGYLGSTSVLL